jgi:hypothetical protein
MAWNKLVVSGSNISQLVNDENYIKSGDAVLSSGSYSGSFQGNGSGLTGVIANAANALADGNGIADFTYNGSTAGILVAVEADGSTLTVGASGVKVSDAGITATQLATSVAGAGLAGGGGTALSVGVDDSSIEITGDTLNVKALGITNGMLAGSIANAKLVNDSVTIGAHEVALGETVTLAETGFNSGSFSGSFQGDFTGTVNIDLADLTAGDGLSGTAYDGQTARTFSVDADGSTLTVAAAGVKVTDGGIDTTQLADEAVNTAKISGSSITTAKIIDAQVTNAKLANSAVTVGSTSISLGAAATTIAGLSSVTSTTFVGALTGNASTATEAAGVAANSVALGTDTTGNYVATLGTGTGVTIGSNTGEGSSPTIAVNYGSSANTAAEGDTSVSFLGTTNEIELSVNTFSTVGAGGSVTIGLPDDVTIGQDLTVARDVVISRNLTVAGTASFQNTTDLDVADRFIRMASGSNAAGDGGIVIQQGSNGLGQAFAFDNASGAAGRWGVKSDFDPSTNTITPDAFMPVAIEGSDNVPTNAAAQYQNKGNIFVGNTGDIWIFS